MRIRRVYRMLWGLLLLFETGLIPATQAQDASALPFPVPSRFERLDGLSHNTILSIAQDSAGYLWVGTPDGLNRYDGYEVTTFRHAPGDSTTLSNNAVKELLVDHKGTLWVGTDGGLNRYDRQTQTFTRLPLGGDSVTVHQGAVLRLLEDAAGDLWITTHAAGLYRRHVDTGRIKSYHHHTGDPNSLADEAVWGLHEDRAGTLWISTARALHRYDRASDYFHRFPIPPSSSLVTIIHEADSVLWFAGEGEPLVFDRQAEQFIKPPALQQPASIQAMLATRDGQQWLGAAEGLYRFDATRQHFVPVLLDSGPEAYLQNHVTTLFEDRVGTLWVGTLGGLYRADPYAKPFAHIGQDPAEPIRLDSKTVMAIREGPGGILWIGTLGGGLQRIDPHTNAVHAYRHQADTPATLCNDLIWSLHADQSGQLWVGTDAGLCALHPRTGRFRRYDLPLDTPGSRQPPVNVLYEDQQGRLWIGSGTGLYRLDPGQDTATRWEIDATPPTSAYRSVQAIQEDRHGYLWVGTFGGLLYRLDPATGDVTPYRLFIAEGQELVSEGIWAIHEDDDGTLWLGSDQGLTHFDPATAAVTHYAQADGLPGSIVYAILDDGDDLWLSTNQGLSRFDPTAEDAVFRNYDTGDGLRNTEFNRRAAFRSPSGLLYFGGMKGITLFDPAHIRDNPFVPPVVLTRIRTASRDTARVVHPEGLDRLVLSYREYAVSFEFAALNFTNPLQNRYAYRLEGFDEAWHAAGERRFANYTNLPPGSYTFRVKGSNDDGLWNEEGAAIRLTVTPPFWQTWWFRVLLGAAVVGLLTVAYRYRVAHLIQIERMRLRIAGDLHDDIGSNLSSIALLSDIVREREHLGRRERRQLARISQSARTMVEALRDIVWSIDPDTDHPLDLVQRMQDTLPDLLGETRWTFEHPPEGLTGSLDMNVRRDVFLIFKEALHNIARHAHAEHVTIRLAEQQDALCLTIADDGVGFEEDPLVSGRGLKHMQERASRIGGTLIVQSDVRQGTTVRLEVPRRRLRLPQRRTHRTA